MKNKIEKAFKGEVYKYRVSKRETEGTEIMKTRWGVIFSTNELNKQKARLVIIPLTSKNIYMPTLNLKNITIKKLEDRNFKPYYVLKEL